MAAWFATALLCYNTLKTGRGGGTVTPEFLAINPAGLIPTLVDSSVWVNGDGTPFVVRESMAIISYLGDHYGGGHALVPRPGSIERTTYDSWCSYVLTELERPMWEVRGVLALLFMQSLSFHVLQFHALCNTQFLGFDSASDRCQVLPLPTTFEGRAPN